MKCDYVDSIDSIDFAKSVDSQRGRSWNSENRHPFFLHTTNTRLNKLKFRTDDDFPHCLFG